MADAFARREAEHRPDGVMTAKLTTRPAKCGCGRNWTVVTISFDVVYRCVLCWLRAYRPDVLARETPPDLGAGFTAPKHLH